MPFEAGNFILVNKLTIDMMFKVFRKLWIALSMIYSMTASAADSLVVYSQINIYPYYFDSESGNVGVLPDVLSDYE